MFVVISVVFLGEYGVQATRAASLPTGKAEANSGRRCLVPGNDPAVYSTEDLPGRFQPEPQNVEISQPSMDCGSDFLRFRVP
jgi:hypothetical protein